MHPLLSQLNRTLKRRGETVWLQRSTAANNTRVRAKVPAIVQALTREQLIGSITQQNLFIIISPTYLYGISQWPGGFTPSLQTFGLITPTDARVPTTNDAIFVRGPQRAITNCKPVFVKDECIRIEITCLG
jgi:hypothetical protein